MKRNYYFILLMFLFTIFNTKLNAQHIDAGDDIYLCPGQTQAMLHAGIERVLTGRYRVESIPFQWDSDFSNAQDVMITDNGTTTPLRIDDRYGDAIDLPFPISFYGRTYDKIVVGSNGDIIFEPSVAATYDSWIIDPTQLIPNHTLPYWDSSNNLSFASIMGAYLDIDISVPSGTEELKYKTIGTAPNRKFMIIYNDIPEFSCNYLLVSQEIVFNEADNSFEVHIKNKPVCGSWNDGLATLGTQNEEFLPDTCGNYPGDITSPTLPNRNTGPWEILEPNSEAYIFIPDANVTVTWYDASRNVIGHDVDLAVEPTEDTTYTLEVSFEDCHGNTFTEFDEVNVYLVPEPQVELPEKVVVCGTETKTIDGTLTNESDFPSVTYTWTDASGQVVSNTAEVVVNSTQVLTLTVETMGNCSHSFDPVNVLNFESCRVPEGVSPDGNGKNDTFMLDYLASEPGIDVLQIYDRRGVLVYEKDNYVNEFDGKDNDGNVLPAATYYYVIKLLDGEKLTGWFQLIR